MSVGAAMNSILKVHGKIRLPKKSVKKFILDIPDYSIIMFLRKYVVIIYVTPTPFTIITW